MPNVELNAGLLAAAEKLNLSVQIGNTISTDDYYEAQARRDGAFCDFSEDEKMAYLKRAHDDRAIRNFEMEATMMLAFATRANVKAAVICVTYLNRLIGDRNGEQEDVDPVVFEQRPLKTVLQYIVDKQ